MNSNINKIIELATKYIGYKEKKDLKSLSSFNDNIGNNNYTIFAKTLKDYINLNVQGQPWCDTFIKAIFIECFGVKATEKMLYGLSVWTPTSYNNFKKNQALREYTSPQVGDIVFFKNNIRIYHTGIVVAVDNENITTIEGNTSNINTVVNNGGEVCKKTYKKNNPKIAGYGVPGYENPSITTYPLNGWLNVGNFYLYYKDGEILKDSWLDYNGLTYYLLPSGIMATGQHFIDDKRYYFDEEKGHLILTNDHGEEKIYKSIDINIKRG